MLRIKGNYNKVYGYKTKYNKIIDLDSRISFSELGIENVDTLSIGLYDVNEITKEYSSL